MKILHMSFSFTQGGIDNMMNDIMKCQYEMGHSISLLILNDDIDDEVTRLLPAGIKTYFLRRPRGSHNPYYLLKLTYLIRFVIKPDIIHCHNSRLGKICYVIGHSMYCKSLLTVHAMSLDTGNYHYFDHIVAISESVKGDILNTYSAHNVTVIYNGINFSLFHAKKTVCSKPIEKLVVVSRLDMQKKGHDILLDALSILKRKGYRYILDIVGDGRSKDDVVQFISQLGLQEEVNMIGSKPRDWVYEHLSEYDLLVQPSRYEGFGLSIVEGIASGIPVLASDIDGPREILRNGRYGFLFKSEDANNLAEVIESIASMDGTELSQKTCDDYKYMKETFSIETTASKYIDLYKTLMAN